MTASQKIDFVLLLLVSNLSSYFVGGLSVLRAEARALRKK